MRELRDDERLFVVQRSIVAASSDAPTAMGDTSDAYPVFVTTEGHDTG